MSNIAFPPAVSSLGCTFVEIEGVIANVVAGNPYNADGALVVSEAAVSSAIQGIPFTADNKVAIIDSAAASDTYQNEGVTHDVGGAIVTVDSAAAVPPLSSSSGLTFDASGALVITETP